MKRLVPLLALVLPGCTLLPVPAAVPTSLDLASLDACRPPAPIPPSIIARVTAQFEEGRTAPPPDMTPEDIAAYRKMEADQKSKDWPNVCRYRAANADLMKLPDSERRVVFMGDSITQNWAFADPVYFTHGTVNRGISGQTTPQMLARFRSDVIALRPRVVHILAGVNDIAGNTGPVTLDDIKGNLASMIEIAQANNVRVVLSTVLPAGSFSWSPDTKPAPAIDKLNAWIRTYAAEKRLVLADYYPALALPDGSMRPEFSLDGVHPNKAGYRAMAPITDAAIKAALGPATLFR